MSAQKQADLTHTTAVELSRELAHPSSYGTPGVRAALKSILETRCSQPLDHMLMEAVLEALTDPVAFAMTSKSDAQYRAGMHAARQHVANQLGLGALERPAGQ